MQSTTTKNPYAQLRQAYKKAQADLNAFAQSADLDDPHQYTHFKTLERHLAKANQARHTHVWSKLPPFHPGDLIPPLTLQAFPTHFHLDPED